MFEIKVRKFFVALDEDGEHALDIVPSLTFECRPPGDVKVEAIEALLDAQMDEAAELLPEEVTFREMTDVERAAYLLDERNSLLDEDDEEDDYDLAN